MHTKENSVWEKKNETVTSETCSLNLYETQAMYFHVVYSYFLAPLRTVLCDGVSTFDL